MHLHNLNRKKYWMLNRIRCIFIWWCKYVYLFIQIYSIRNVIQRHKTYFQKKTNNKVYYNQTLFLLKYFAIFPHITIWLENWSHSIPANHSCWEQQMFNINNFAILGNNISRVLTNTMESFANKGNLDL